MTLKILLATPLIKYPVKKNNGAGEVGIPTGLLYLAAYLREKNPRIDIKIQTNRLNQYKGIERNLEKDFADFDIIATGACTAEYPDAINMLAKAKEMGKTTIIGGIFPTTNSDFVLNSGVVDYLIRGEGEIAFSNLIHCISNNFNPKNISGLSFRSNGTNIHNKQQTLIKNLNELPIPAYDLVDMQTYSKIGTAPMYTTRGCPMTCKFCSLNEHWQFKYRARSIENILKEVELLKDYGFDRINFKDETLTLNKKRTLELFNRLKDYHLNIKCKSRIDTIDSELLGVMSNAGLDCLQFGVESMSQKLLDSMKKGITINQIKETLDYVVDYTSVNPIFIFGWIGEDIDTLKESSAYIESISGNKRIIPYISFLTPHPGTEIFTDRRLEILTHDLNFYTHKNPVAIPISLKINNGFDFMISNYNYLAQITNTAYLNPIIRNDYIANLKEYGGTEKWKSKLRLDVLITYQ